MFSYLFEEKIIAKFQIFFFECFDSDTAHFYDANLEQLLVIEKTERHRERERDIEIERERERELNNNLGFFLLQILVSCFVDKFFQNGVMAFDPG